METRLTIKHLAPYLPYKVKLSDIHILHCGQGIGSVGHLLTTKSDQFKMRLRPLEEAEQVIFEAFENTSKKGNKEIVDLFSYEEIGEDFMFSEYDNLEWLPYESFIWLVKNHFDVFKLREKGLAINKNEL